MQRSTRLMQPLAAAVLAAGLLSASAAIAQAPAQPPAQQSQNIPDQKLDATAAAIIRVAALKDEYMERIEKAEPSEKQRLAQEAKGALEKAVTDQGLSVDEYNTIVKTAESDPDVLEKLRQRLPPDAR